MPFEFQIDLPDALAPEEHDDFVLRHPNLQPARLPAREQEVL